MAITTTSTPRAVWMGNPVQSDHQPDPTEIVNLLTEILTRAASAADLSFAVSGLAYQGIWDADANSPTMPAAAGGNEGHFYWVGTAGTTTIDGVSDWAVGDYLISDGSTWNRIRIDVGVLTVAGRTGAVTLDISDISDATAAGQALVTAASAPAQKALLALESVDNTADADKPVSAAQQTALDLKADADDLTETYVPMVGNWRELTVDSANRPVCGTKTDGSEWVAVGGVMVRADTAAASTDAPTYDYEATTGTEYPSGDVDVLTLVIGQSLAAGSGADNTIITSSAEYPDYALMPAPGVAPGASAFTAYADLKESGTSETVCSGMANAIMRRLIADLGAEKRMIFAVSALGGQAYYGDASLASGGLKRGSDTYAETLGIVKRCRDVSGAAGRTLIVRAAVVLHGEEDYKILTTNAAYRMALQQWRRNLDGDIKAITGQTEDLVFVASQANRGSSTLGIDPRTPQATLDASHDDPNILLAGPIYFGAQSGDNSHPSNRAYRRMGIMLGNVLMDGVFGPYFAAAEVRAAYWTSSTTIRLEFAQDMAIESDDTKVTISTLGSGKGVDFADGTGSPPTVTGIALGPSDKFVDVTLSGAPSGYRPQIFIACRRTDVGPGNVTGARSGLRVAASYDTDPDDGAALYHWACQQVVNIQMRA